ncbi:MAG: hypothetical protein ACLFTK_09295 [Anaerolineales bacterium]
MAKKTATHIEETPEEAYQSPLEQFVEHQRQAAMHAGRAVASLIPRGLREHSVNAVEESAKGVQSLVGGLGSGAQRVGKRVDDATRRLKDDILLPQDEQPQTKSK